MAHLSKFYSTFFPPHKATLQNFNSFRNKRSQVCHSQDCYVQPSLNKANLFLFLSKQNATYLTTFLSIYMYLSSFRYASADRTKRSAGHTDPGVCTPYQAVFPNGYCKDIIGYLPVYGTNQKDMVLNEMKMVRYREAINLLIKNNTLDARQSCLEMVDDVYCHHYFKRCYISSRPPLICREACEELFSKACDREYKKVQNLGYNFDIIDCTTLPSRNGSSHCYYPDKIRGQWREAKHKRPRRHFFVLATVLRTFALIVYAHPYCARNSCRNVTPRHASSARAEETFQPHIG